MNSLKIEDLKTISDAVSAMDALIILGEQNVPAPYKPLKERFTRDRLKRLLTKLENPNEETED